MCSASFRSSCKAGLVVTNSLSTCLFTKDCIFPWLVKLSLAGYEILGWKFFSLRMLNVAPDSLLVRRVSAERSTVSLMGFSLWMTHSFSLTALFPFFQLWWIWWLCALGLLFLRNIFVVFSAFPVFECQPPLLSWGSSPRLYPAECFPAWIHSPHHLPVHHSGID